MAVVYVLRLLVLSRHMLGLETVAFWVLDYRLENQVGESRLESFGLDIHLHRHSILKSYALDFEITLEKLELFVKRDFLFARIFQRQSKKVAEPGYHRVGGACVFIHERGDRIQSVEQEVRMQLHLERL